jgi:hypothetical protein
MQGFTATVLIVTGVLTISAGIGALAPRRLGNVFFAISGGDAPTVLLLRHWSLLIALVGGLLVYAGFHPEASVPVMFVGIAEKLALGAFVVTSELRKRPVTVAIVTADAVMALLYLFILIRYGA